MQAYIVERALMPQKVSDERVLSAYLSIERETFLPFKFKSMKNVVEEPIFLEEDRFLAPLQPYATLIQEANIQEGEKVLVFPFSCGYISNLLDCLSKNIFTAEEKRYHTLFEDSTQATSCPEMTDKCLFIETIDDLSHLDSDFDVIFIDGAVEELPHVFLEKLSAKGRLVYVDATKDNMFYGRVVYKNKPETAKAWYSEKSTPKLNLFRRKNVFEF